MDEIVEWKVPIVCEASPNVNKWTKKSANLGGEKVLFGTPSWRHQPPHSF